MTTIQVQPACRSNDAPTCCSPTLTLTPNPDPPTQPACRIIRANRLLTYPPRPVLAAAVASEDSGLFYAVYTFFTQRNEIWRGSAAFLPEEGCEEYVGKWEQLFGAIPGGANL